METKLMQFGLMVGEVVTPAVDLTELKTALTSAITPDQIVTLLASIIGVGMSFFLLWMGVRKLVGSFSAAVKSGRIKI